MPLYEYQCTKCGNRFERIQKFSDPLVTECPQCAGRVEQLISAPAVVFKGSGWYVTDYAKKNSSTASSQPSGSNGKGEVKAEAAKPTPALSGAGSKAETKS